MKKILATFISLLFFVSMTTAQQKIVVVNTEYILNNIPKYETAKAQLDELSKKWQKEVEEKYAEIDKLYKDYQAQKVLLSEDQQTKKEEEIINKEKEVKDLQKKYFGKEGDLYKKRQELIKPIQEEIYTAVKGYAEEGGFSIIIDTSGGLSILYSDPKLDKSDEILEKLGYKN